MIPACIASNQRYNRITLISCHQFVNKCRGNAIYPQKPDNIKTEQLKIQKRQKKTLQIVLDAQKISTMHCNATSILFCFSYVFAAAVFSYCGKIQIIIHGFVLVVVVAANKVTVSATCMKQCTIIIGFVTLLLLLLLLECFYSSFFVFIFLLFRIIKVIKNLRASKQQTCGALMIIQM